MEIKQGKAGNIQKAISLFKEAIEIHPFYAEAYNNLGYAYTRQKEYEKAKEAFRKALEIEPDHKRARVNLNYLDNLNKERMD